MEKAKVSFVTLGCKLNFSESSWLSNDFEKQGFVSAPKGEPADVYIVNTCAVTASAEKKCRGTLRSLRRKHPDAVIAAVGCMSQLRADGIAAMPEVDLVLGSAEKFHAVASIQTFLQTREKAKQTSGIRQTGEFFGSFSSGSRTRSFLKIQDGCDHFCSYCTIPLARGRSRSADIQTTVELAQRALGTGAKEIVLTGVNIGDFGRQSGESLFQLLLRLVGLKGLQRLRLSSIEPELLSREIIELVYNCEKLMPHFHLPLQAGNNEVLKAMRRRYRRQLVAQLIRDIHTLMPHAFIAMDVIAGYPTETSEQFDDALEAINEMNISCLHVFPFSPRPDTAAAGLKPVYHPDELRRRTQALLHLSEEKQKAFYLANKGVKAKVLFESTLSKGMLSGFTENYLEVRTPYRKEYVNEIIPVTLDTLNEEGIFVAI